MWSNVFDKTCHKFFNCLKFLNVVFIMSSLLLHFLVLNENENENEMCVRMTYDHQNIFMLMNQKPVDWINIISRDQWRVKTKIGENKNKWQIGSDACYPNKFKWYCKYQRQLQLLFSSIMLYHIGCKHINDLLEVFFFLVCEISFRLSISSAGAAAARVTSFFIIFILFYFWCRTFAIFVYFTELDSCHALTLHAQVSPS